MIQDPPWAVLIMGPTASGKTALAKALCDVRPCQIINVDSAQFYRGMDIGSAKPSRDELERYPHRMLDFLDPAESYSVARFRARALSEIEAALSAGKLPLLVGGSMLYFKVLLEGINELPATDPQLRERLKLVQTRKGLAYLYRWLGRVDPECAQRLHPNDTQRIVRALEVYVHSGQRLSVLQQPACQPEALAWQWFQVILQPQDRAALHQRIEQRFDLMLDNGLLAEVERLFRRGDLALERNPALRAVGYRQSWMYLDGQMPYARMRERGIIATRQFAKRQYTWLRNWLCEHQHGLVLDSSDLLYAEQEAQQQLLTKLRDKVLAALPQTV